MDCKMAFTKSYTMVTVFKEANNIDHVTKKMSFFFLV